MLTRRLIVCLDVKDGRVVKGTNFEHLRDVGDPSAMAVRYECEGADEVVFLDISASTDERATLLEVVRRTAEQLFVPLTVGGGIRSTSDVMLCLRSGADKVSMNSSAVACPQLLTEAASRFGSQCVVASIDAKWLENRWIVYTHGGSRRTTLDAVEWAAECVRLGAGEILLTSIDRDGSRSGYDIELTREISRAVNVPVIASGGAADAASVVAGIVDGCADAALVAGILHDGLTTIRDIKAEMARAGIPVRNAA
ncbi:MAG TPA: imidazole glycerol phosphate synthase subunit HisF [Gemmatimonadaceae bacterium]|nr:imidazole glycerol phosphate synthase subunit HisF [Gemmatimonadaceae bacterium]